MGDSAARVDPVTLEVIRSAVSTIAEEMRAILMRSARAPILKEAGDLSCALTDAEGRLLAQGRDIPIHLGVMAFTVQEFLKRVPASTLQEGDHYFTNDPIVGGNHLPDVKAIHPIFYRGKIVAFAINLAHWPDVGGARAGSYVPSATELHQEGLIIPPVKVFDRDGAVRDTLAMILRNVRDPEQREGDILAQYATNQVTARRLVELFDRFGAETVLACFARFLDESEMMIRRELARIPDGVYLGEDFLDNDGISDEPVRIAVAVTVRGDEVALDFSGTSPQIAGPLNATPYVASSAVYYSVRAVCEADIPTNAGCFRPISIHIPQGTVLRPGPDAPVVGGNHETSQRVADAVLRAFAQVVPERISAGGPTTSGVLLISARHQGRNVTFYEVHGGGEGARAERDGMSAIRVHMSNVMNTPAESVEAEYPILIEEQSIRRGSGGRGIHRGGDGFVRAYRILAPEALLTSMVERCVFPPWGLLGGEPGQPFRIWLERDGERRPIPGKAAVDLRRGDLVVIETSGGGGYGMPSGSPGA
jgi:N-methylhydantoinase B